MTYTGFSWAASALVLVLAAGCNGGHDVTGNVITAADASDSQASAPMTTKDPTGADPTGDEPTTGGETGDGGTTGEVDPPATREACELYLACLSATQPEILPSAQAGYGENGTCWMGTLVEQQQCVDACQTGLEKQHESYPAEQKCYLCQDDADCPATDACLAAECRPKTCGDMEVQAPEICDGPYCDDDCRGPAACTPLNNVGCEKDQFCEIDGDGDEVCVPIKPGTVLQKEGDACNADPNEICAPGLFCMNQEQFAACPTPFCCIRYCDTNAFTECPGDSFCIELEYVDKNVSATELQEYLGVCYGGS